MRKIRRFVPRHGEARAMGAEDGIGCVVGKGIVGALGDDCLRVFARLVVIEPPAQRAAAMGERGKGLLLRRQKRKRRLARYKKLITDDNGRLSVSAQARQIAQHPAERV